VPVRPPAAVAVLLAAACTLLVTACGSLLPGLVEPQGCPGALLEGTIVRDEQTGLGVHNAEVDVTYPVQWPDGTSVDESDGVRRLVDAGGAVLGAEGDRFSAGGGFTSGPNEVFQPCGGIEITRAGD
jgi:hypothetical protein